MDRVTAKPAADWPDRFLAALRAGKGPVQAARDVGVEGSTPYRRRGTDAAFRAAWQAIKGADGRSNPARPRAPRASGKVDRFIAALVESSNVAAAAAAAELDTGQIYRLRRTDPAFARRWFAALAEGYDNLEMELLGRLRAGDNGDGAKGRFNTATAFRCLAAHRENVAREKGRQTLADEVATIAAINEKIDRLRLNERAGDKAIAAARKANRARLSSSGGCEAQPSADPVGQQETSSSSEAVGQQKTSSSSEAVGQQKTSSSSDAVGQQKASSSSEAVGQQKISSRSDAADARDDGDGA